MSIPVSIDPLGTLGAELPFVQPIMTSNDTWDTTLPASCGMVLTGDQTQVRNAKWMAFDGDAKTTWAVYSNGGSMTVDFEQPVKITRLHISSMVRTTNVNYILLSGDRELGRYHGLEGVFEVIVDNPAFSKTYKLSIVPDKVVAGVWIYTYDIKINGFIAV